MFNIFKKVKTGGLMKHFGGFKRDQYVYMGIFLFVSLLTCISFKRQVLNYGTETDLLWQFVPEAVRFLNGERLWLDFHPPLYSIVMALLYSLTGNWLKAGLILSIVSAFVVINTCYKFFSLKFGKIEGLGAILALAVSATFVHSAMQATTDVFFMALFFSSLTFIALGEAKHKGLYWLLAGAFTGMAIITRGNGIVLIGFLLFAMYSEGIKISKHRAVTLLATGILIPIGTWVSFAIYSSSPVFPISKYKALALTYFPASSEHTSIDAVAKVSEGLTDTWQVLAKDLQYIVKIYAGNLVDKTNKLVTTHDLLPFPYVQLAIAGLFFLIFTDFDRFKQALALNLLGMFLLLNFAAWAARYYLYIVPFMGAGITALLCHIYTKTERRINNIILILVLGFSFVFGLLKLKNTLEYSFSNLAFDSFEASKVLKNNHNSPNSIVLARKPHLSFYAGLDHHWFPDLERIEDLKSALDEMAAHQADNKAIYLFYGYFEGITRPKLAALKSLDLNVYWLHRMAWGNENGGWVLYETLRDKLKTNQDLHRNDHDQKDD